MDNEIYIKVSSLTRHFGHIKAVEDISFEVKKGEILGFLGPNGAGKSTTMQMLTGNLAPTRGEIIIKGVDLLEQPKKAKSYIGYLPEHPPLYKEFTVREYLNFCARLNRIIRADVNAAVDKCIQRLGLEPVQHRLIANLSKGFQQRVGIAQAIVHEPPIIIMDEPTVGLDPNQIRDIRALISELGKEHCLILSTHILSEVQAICDRVQIINQGQLMLQEAVSQLDKHLNSRSICLGFDTDRQVSDFSNIANIESVNRLDNNRFRIRHHPERNPTRDIVRLSVEKDWKLVELTPEKQTLEAIFVNITQSGTKAKPEPKIDETKIDVTKMDETERHPG